MDQKQLCIFQAAEDPRAERTRQNQAGCAIGYADLMKEPQEGRCLSQTVQTRSQSRREWASTRHSGQRENAVPFEWKQIQRACSEESSHLGISKTCQEKNEHEVHEQQQLRETNSNQQKPIETER